MTNTAQKYHQEEDYSVDIPAKIGGVVRKCIDNPRKVEIFGKEIGAPDLRADKANDRILLKSKGSKGNEVAVYVDGSATIDGNRMDAIEAFRPNMASVPEQEWLEDADPLDVLSRLVLLSNILIDNAFPTVGGAVVQWAEPEAIVVDLKPVKRLRDMIEIVPPLFRRWVADVADRMGCPDEYVAIPLMVGLGSVAGHAICVQPKRHDTGWKVYPNLYACIVGRPGAFKSPAIAEGLKSIYSLEDEAKQDYEERMIEYRRDAEILEEFKDVTKQKTRKAIKDAQSKAEAIRKAKEASAFDSGDDDLEEPVRRRYFVGDGTPQAVAQIIQRHAPNGALVVRDELAPFLISLESEENQAGRSIYLSGWNGRAREVIDRIGRGCHNDINGLTLSLIGTTQPAKLPRLIGGARDGGSNDDGLVQRILWIYPDVPSGRWKNVDRAPNEGAFHMIDSVFKWVDRTAKDHSESPMVVMMDDEAGRVFLQWREELENGLRGSEFPEYLEPWASKMRKHVPAIALICWLADDNRGVSIGADHLRMALGWFAFLREHAERCFAYASSPAKAMAIRLVKRIHDGDLVGSFTARDLARKGWEGVHGESVPAALSLLIEHGYLRESPRKGAGRPTVDYEVNPKAVSKKGQI